MLTLRFESAGMGPQVTVGPARSFRVGGNMLHRDEEPAPVARYQNHSWAVGGRHHTRYVSEGPARVRFENLHRVPSETYGPYREFSASDGVLYVDGELFAKFVEETQLWHCFPTDTYWPTLIIESANGDSAPPSAG